MKKASSRKKRPLRVFGAKGSSYLPCRRSIRHRRDLAPFSRPENKLGTSGCCGFIGPNPQPLSIREVFSCESKLLEFGAFLSRKNAQVTIWLGDAGKNHEFSW